MRTRTLIIVSLAAALFAAPAMAQFAAGMQSGMEVGPTGMGMPGGGQGRATRGPADCSQSANPGQCRARQEAHQKTFEACKDKVGAELRQCMHAQAQRADCAQARSPQQCQARKQAYAACRGQTGAKFASCVERRLPATGCSGASDAALCAQHEKARTLCADKNGAEHLQCLRDVLAPGR
ncbi:MAG: hypothetical protein IAE88_15520 [Rhodobacteraceae bacterium]|nr:hypothetical protein [Paracoccaceae bacterium]